MGFLSDCVMFLFSCHLPEYHSLSFRVGARPGARLVFSGPQRPLRVPHPTDRCSVPPNLQRCVPFVIGR